MKKKTGKKMYLHLLNIYALFSVKEARTSPLRLIVEAGLACNAHAARLYLLRMATLGMVKDVGKRRVLMIKAIPLRRSARVIKKVALELGLLKPAERAGSHKPADKSLKTVDNLLITRQEPVDRTVGKLRLNVDNLLVKLVFGKSYPHPVDKFESYPQPLLIT